MSYKDTKKFTIKELEETGGKKIIKAINKRGIGNLKIVVPTDSELKKGDELQVMIKGVKDEEN